MRKIISIFLISTLVLTLLCGCEGDNNVSSDVSQIEAVVNMSSEETLSEIENVSSTESIVSSEPQVSSQASVVSSEISVSSEVSTPTQIIEGTPINFEIVYSKMDFSCLWEDDYKIVDSVEEIETLEEAFPYKSDKQSEFYDMLKEKYDAEFFETKAIILFVVIGADYSFTRFECNNVTRKDSKLLIYASKYIDRTPGSYFPQAFVPASMVLEVDKSEISGIEEVVMNAQKIEYTE